MKKAVIISIGNELTNGQTIDTNAAYLSSNILSVGIPTVAFHTVGDDADLISDTFRIASQQADIIIATGGLGPTDDDVTRQGLAKFLNVDLELDEKSLQRIKDNFTRRSVTMPKINEVQAHIPKGTKAINNDIGTAPGIYAEKEDKLFFITPGVPSEMKRIFENYILPELKKFVTNQFVFIKKLYCFGTSESALAEMLGDMMRRDRNPLINCTVSGGVITLHIIVSSDDPKKAQELLQNDEVLLQNLLKTLIFSTDCAKLEQVVGKLLSDKHLTVAIAESCTGGLVAKLLTDVPGSSRYFTYGWIPYSNAAKISELNVSPDLINNYGAVSSQVAEALAVGALKKAGTNYAISITGIAGPDGGTEQKPVGLVYITLAGQGGLITQKLMFPNSREIMRLRTAYTAINMLRLKIAQLD